MGLGNVVSVTSGDREALLAAIPKADVLVTMLGHRIDADLLNVARRLRLIVTPTTGLNHIDIELCRKLEIKVLSLKGDTAFLRTVGATAELTWGLLLELSRKVGLAVHDVKYGNWGRYKFVGHELRGKTLGVIGLGRLGSMVAQYGLAFGMNVLGNDVDPKAVVSGVESTDLNDLLRRSDVVSVHIPLDGSTANFLNRDRLSQIRTGAILINTSRGEILDESALVDLLRTGQLGGFAADVLCGETSGQSDWLNASPIWQAMREDLNVILTPHIGGATHESLEKACTRVVQRIEEFL